MYKLYIGIINYENTKEISKKDSKKYRLLIQINIQLFRYIQLNETRIFVSIPIVLLKQLRELLRLKKNRNI